MGPSRRATVAGVAAALMCRGAASAPDTFATIEETSGSRVGVVALDTGNGRRVAHRPDERFPICSTFKLVAAGLILRRVERGEEALDRAIRFGPDQVVAGSPLTGPRAGPDGMRLAEICRAAITRSDNTAGNLMLASFGGPAALTGFARDLGDPVTRLDRWETALNEALPDDPRDTTSPAAMVTTAARLLVGDGLADASRRQLLQWLDANETGAARIRSAVPPGAAVGDKTGTGERGAASDVALVRLPGRAPIALAIYLHGSRLDLDGLNRTIARTASVALAELG